MIKRTMLCDVCNKPARSTLLVTLEHRRSRPISLSGARRRRSRRINPFYGAVDFCAACAKKPIAPRALVALAIDRQKKNVTFDD